MTYNIYVYSIASNGDISLPISRGVNTGDAYPCSGYSDITKDNESDNTIGKPEFALYQNSPNPFNLTTEIVFSIPGILHVSIEIYDVLGRKVRKITDREYKPGIHSLTWDGKNEYGGTVASGMYFYKIQAGEYSETRKMLIMK